MKKSIIAATMAIILPNIVVAASGYIEGQLGYAWIDDVDTDSVSAPEFGTASASLDYDDDISYGIEIGLQNFEDHNVLRLGLSWTQFDADLDKAKISITGGTDIGPISGSVSSGELKSEGLSFDNTVNIYMANLYYDFPVEMKFKPYLGLGIGIADIDNADDEEGAWSFSVGGRYEITEKTKLGIKYSRISIDGPSDDLGLSYDDIDVDHLTATISYDF